MHPSDMNCKACFKQCFVFAFLTRIIRHVVCPVFRQNVIPQAGEAFGPFVAKGTRVIIPVAMGSPNVTGD